MSSRLSVIWTDQILKTFLVCESVLVECYHLSIFDPVQSSGQTSFGTRWKFLQFNFMAQCCIGQFRYGSQQNTVLVRHDED